MSELKIQLQAALVALSPKSAFDLLLKHSSLVVELQSQIEALI
jgi:hypothetical protein